MHSSTGKPKILVVADRPNWAYHHIANFITGELGREFDFSLDFLALNGRPEFKHRKTSPWSAAKRAAILQWNAIRYRRVRRDGKYDLILLLGFYFDTAGRFGATAPRLVKGIYTQGFPPQGMGYDHFNKVGLDSLTRQQFRDLYLANADTLVCGAPAICEEYGDIHPRVRCANMAYDEQRFSPAGHVASPPDRLVVGWTGNPKREFKGFRTHIVPAVEKAAKQRPGIVLKTRFEGPLETLHEFYKDVDVIAIASEADAGPSMYMEAALSGVPAISNRIGIPFSAIQDGKNGLIVPRDVDALAEAMVRLYDDRSLLRAMSQRVRSDFIAQFGRAAQRENWRNLFNELL